MVQGNVSAVACATGLPDEERRRGKRMVSENTNTLSPAPSIGELLEHQPSTSCCEYVAVLCCTYCFVVAYEERKEDK